MAGIQLTTCEGGLVQPTTTPWPSKGFHFCEIQNFLHEKLSDKMAFSCKPMISTTTKETTTGAATFGDLNALLPLQQEND